MIWRFGPFVMPFTVSAAISVVMALSLWSKRRVPGATCLIALLIGTAWWAVAELIQYGAQELDVKIFWTNLVYCSVVSMPVLWFVFSLRYSGARERLRPSEWAALWVIPAITLVFLWWKPTTELMRTNVRLDASGPVTHMIKTYGPWFWVMVGYSYLLMAWGSVYLLRSVIRLSRVYKVQAILLVVGLAVPWVMNIAYLIGQYRWFPFDPTAIAFSASGILLAVALHITSLFELTPAARDAAIRAMRDGWIVLDAKDRIVDLNPAAQRALGGINPRGRCMSLLEPRLSPLLQLHRGEREPVALKVGGAVRYYDVAMSELMDRRGETAGYVVTLRDITRRMERDREREELIAALQQALSEVKQLSGLLPICARCKKIRDDQGYWTQLEQYISQHSGASFTHGLCPDCMAAMLREAGLGEEEDHGHAA